MGDRKIIKEAKELKKVLWKRRTTIRKALKRSELKEAREIRKIQRSVRYRRLRRRERDILNQIGKLRNKQYVVEEAMDNMEEQVRDEFEGRWVGQSVEEKLSRYIHSLAHIKGFLKSGYLSDVEKIMGEVRTIVQEKGKEEFDGN